MSIVDRLRRRTPDSELPPLVPESFDDLLATAKLRGVKGFIAIQPEMIPDQDQPDQAEVTTRFEFTTKSGRRAEFSESYGIHPDTRDTALRGVVTAMRRRTQIHDNTELVANVIDGYDSDGPHIVIDPFSSMTVLRHEDRTPGEIESFIPHPQPV